MKLENKNHIDITMDLSRDVHKCLKLNWTSISFDVIKVSTGNCLTQSIRSQTRLETFLLVIYQGAEIHIPI